MKQRAELDFKPLNVPQPLDCDYSDEVDEAAIQRFEKSRPHEWDEGTLISGDVWV